MYARFGGVEPEPAGVSLCQRLVLSSWHMTVPSVNSNIVLALKSGCVRRGVQVPAMATPSVSRSTHGATHRPVCKRDGNGRSVDALAASTTLSHVGGGHAPPDTGVLSLPHPAGWAKVTTMTWLRASHV